MNTIKGILGLIFLLTFFSLEVEKEKKVKEGKCGFNFEQRKYECIYTK